MDLSDASSSSDEEFMDEVIMTIEDLVGDEAELPRDVRDAQVLRLAEECGTMLSSAMWDDTVLESLCTLQYLCDYCNPEVVSIVARSDAAIKGLLTGAKSVGIFLDCETLDQACMCMLANLTFQEPDYIMAGYLREFCSLYDPVNCQPNFERTYLLSILNFACFSRSPDALRQLRDAGLVETLKPCFESSDPERFTFMAALLIAILTGNQENNILLLPGHTEIFDHIAGILNNALDDDPASCYQRIKWSALSPTLTFKILSTADSAKGRIIESGALPLLAALLRRDHGTVIDREQDFDRSCVYAAQALYHMSFAVSLEEQLPGIKETLSQIVARSSAASDLREAAAGILYQMALMGQNTDVQSEQENTSVAVCFSACQREAAEEVGRRLTGLGLEVTESSDEAQAHQVEVASTVVCLMSPEFKESAPCRTQVEVAQRMGKRMVGVIAEPGYRPDGWLGRMIDQMEMLDITQDGQFEALQPTSSD